MTDSKARMLLENLKATGHQPWSFISFYVTLRLGDMRLLWFPGFVIQATVYLGLGNSGRGKTGLNVLLL
jgi:hypothetical protein